MSKSFVLMMTVLLVAACGARPEPGPEEAFFQPSEALVLGRGDAISYSGFREGQHPDRGDGAVNPSDAEIREDLTILVDHGIALIRLYDSGENSVTTLELIREHELPIKVLLGAWLKAEISNHEGCPWLDEPIPEATLQANVIDNEAELSRLIALANDYRDVVVAVNVGNEALVDWNDHMVSLESVIAYVRRVKAAIDQPVTVADNFRWWVEDGAPLAAEVDFIGVHSYPIWEQRGIDDALAFTVENLNDVKAALPDKPILVLEAGWPTTSVEFGALASVENQRRYFKEFGDWAKTNHVTVFWFEAFDEPWKGDPSKPLEAEKHWGFFYVDRTPKSVADLLRRQP